MKRLRNVPWVSGMLVVINVIVFLMCTFSGNVLYNKGELDVVSVRIEVDETKIQGGCFHD